MTNRTVLKIFEVCTENKLKTLRMGREATTRPVGLAVICEHWTPKGDCMVTGSKERN